MKVIARYITKELHLSFVSIVGILFLIVLSNRLAVYLGKAAVGDLPMGTVFDLILYYTPELLSYLIPLGFYLSILFTFGKFYTDQEMIVMYACGISQRQVLRIILASASVWMCVTASLTMWIVPNMADQREELLANSAMLAFKDSLVTQQFQSYSGGKVIFYIDNKNNETDKLQEVFIADLSKSDINNWVVMKAKEAELSVDEDQKSIFLTLNQGFRYQGSPGTKDYIVTQFNEYGKMLTVVDSSERSTKQRSESTYRLFDEYSPRSMAEFQWRLSLPMSLIVLALLAFPLARVNPRQGKISRLLPAVLLYIIYYNLFTICRRWVAAEVLPAWIGAWWVHAVFFSIGFYWILVQNKRGSS